MKLDEGQAVEDLMALLAQPGLSGRERPVADLLIRRLVEAGCDPAWIREDDAHTRIPHDFEMGNLIVRMPGTVPGPCIFFSGHLDTVPLVRGAVPRREGKRIVPAGRTALGADNRTACGAILTLAATLLRENLPHPPITLLFSVGEEIGLWGAKEVNPAELGHPVMGFNIDSGDPEKVIVGAIGAHRWSVQIQGISSHAGVHPEHGVSATLIAARAITEIAAKGYFGLIDLHGRKGTSNVGVIQGGEATNQVTDLVTIRGESRSHDPDFLEEITATIEQAFRDAAASVRNHSGRCGEITFHCERDYGAFRIPESAPPVERTCAALRALGLQPVLEVTNGGLDANYYNTKGMPTVTLGAGQHNPHTVDEYADVDQYLTCCRLLLEIVSGFAGG